METFVDIDIAEIALFESEEEFITDHYDTNLNLNPSLDSSNNIVGINSHTFDSGAFEDIWLETLLASRDVAGTNADIKEKPLSTFGDDDPEDPFSPEFRSIVDIIRDLTLYGESEIDEVVVNGVREMNGTYVVDFGFDIGSVEFTNPFDDNDLCTAFGAGSLLLTAGTLFLALAAAGATGGGSLIYWSLTVGSGATALFLGSGSLACNGRSS